MSDIQMELIRELRARTGAGLMDCKQALVLHSGDMEKAVQLLRERGLSSAAKKAGRTASEGLVHACVDADRNVGVLLEVNCETDFVAKNPSFKAFVQEVAELAAEREPVDVDDLAGFPTADGSTVDETVKGLVNAFGENISIRRFVRYQANPASAVYDYVHDDYLTAGKLGVLLEVAARNAETLSNPECSQFIKSLALHIAAARPRYVGRVDVPPKVLEREITIYRTQAMSEGKSEALAERILWGRLETFYKDACLLEQPYVRDNAHNIAALLEQINAKFGDDVSIVRFARFEKGEIG